MEDRPSRPLRIRFSKMSGAGNDFIMLDEPRDLAPELLPILARHLCARRRSVGADGLLVLAESSRADIGVLYFNSDGSEAAMCGNGARCAALRARQLGLVENELLLEMGGSRHRTVVMGSRVRVEMPGPRQVRRKLMLEMNGRTIEADGLTIGVPHVVVAVPRIEEVPVAEWGSRLRNHEAFRPQGTNVDFIQLVDSGPVPIRTYERGVEGETLACGTGCTAAAIVVHWETNRPPPVDMATRGGDVLRVHFRPVPTGISDLYLEGEARLVFAGEVEIDPSLWRETGPSSEVA